MAFEFLGGHLALDFVNTVGGRTHTSANRYTIDRERLESVRDLDEWLALAKLRGRSDVERAIPFREALYRIFKAVAEQRRPDPKDTELLNRTLAGQRLTFKGATASFTADDPLTQIAIAAAELLTSPNVSRLRACGGESCGWLFLDTSRNRSRQWCDMSDCGNAAKVRRFRDRQRQRSGTPASSPAEPAASRRHQRASR